MSEIEQCLLLGQDYITYGNIGVCELDEKTACAISVGSDKLSPSLANKGNKLFPNEDAVLMLRKNNWLLLAVADAHYGHWASHVIMAGLIHTFSRNNQVFNKPRTLYDLLYTIPESYMEPDQKSASTALIICINTNNGKGVGLSYGDSSAMLINHQEAVRINHKNINFVSVNTPESYGPQFADEFDFVMRPNETLLLFTDGVDECNYCSPSTSVNESHILEQYHLQPKTVCQYLINLTDLALKGVNGNPGGQDNIAIASFHYGY